MSTTIAGLGCGGVDVEEWRKKNRVKLYPGKVNHWVLARTLKDNPDDDDLKQTLFAVMNKWFKGSPIDPALELSSGGRAGNTDAIQIVAISRSLIDPPAVMQTRDQLPYPPIPTVTAGPVVFIHVKFAYRGRQSSMPWPVRTSPGWAGVQLQTSAQCPIDADWMLVSAGKAVEKAPPKETVSEAVKEKAAEVAKTANNDILKPLVKTVGAPLLFAGLGFGAFLAWKLTRK